MASRIQRPSTAFSLDPSDKSQKRLLDDPHLVFIRKLPSIISGAYGCEACHLRAGSPIYRKKRTGLRQKPDDSWTLPMTPEEHRAQHAMNELEFYRQHGIEDPFALCLKLYEATRDFEAGKLIIITSLKSRGIAWNR